MECSKVCGNCGKPIWFDNIPGRGWRHSDMSYKCFPVQYATPGKGKDEAEKPKA
jgi:hypothetical protein